MSRVISFISAAAHMCCTSAALSDGTATNLFHFLPSLVDGKEVVVKKSTKKTSYTVKGEKKGTECTFAVKAYVNKKWTKVTDSDKATIKAK